MNYLKQNATAFRVFTSHLSANEQLAIRLYLDYVMLHDDAEPREIAAFYALDTVDFVFAEAFFESAPWLQQIIENACTVSLTLHEHGVEIDEIF